MCKKEGREGVRGLCYRTTLCFDFLDFRFSSFVYGLYIVLCFSDGPVISQQECHFILSPLVNVLVFSFSVFIRIYAQLRILKF